MQRRARFEGLDELFLAKAVRCETQVERVFRATLSIAPQRFSLRTTRLPDRLRNQLEDLVGWLLKREVFEPALDLLPFLTIARTKRRRIVLERLMKNCDQQQRWFLGLRRGLGQLLKNEQVFGTTTLDSVLEEFSQFVDHKQHAARLACR